MSRALAEGVVPEKPERQTHMNPPGLLMHTESWRQGEASHSFMSRLQSVPKYPGTQLHWKLEMHKKNILSQIFFLTAQFKSLLNVCQTKPRHNLHGEFLRKLTDREKSDRQQKDLKCVCVNHDFGCCYHWTE